MNMIKDGASYEIFRGAISPLARKLRVAQAPLASLVLRHHMTQPSQSSRTSNSLPIYFASIRKRIGRPRLTSHHHTLVWFPLCLVPPDSIIACYIPFV